MKIRYHHLLCLPRFEGKGYSEDFCENLKSVLPEFNKGSFELTDGKDDICRSCPNMTDGVCKSEDKVRRYDSIVKKLLSEGISPEPKDVCSDCEWFYICRDK